MVNKLEIRELQHMNHVDDMDANKLVAGTGPTGPIGPTVAVQPGVFFIPRITLTSGDAVLAVSLNGGGSINGIVIPFTAFGAAII